MINTNIFGGYWIWWILPGYWIFMCRLKDGAISQRAEVTVPYSSGQVGFAAGRNSNFVYIFDKKYFIFLRLLAIFPDWAKE